MGMREWHECYCDDLDAMTARAHMALSEAGAAAILYRTLDPCGREHLAVHILDPDDETASRAASLAMPAGMYADWLDALREDGLAAIVPCPRPEPAAVIR